jgi:hypothetical protein
VKLRHRFWLFVSDVAYYMGAWSSPTRGYRWSLYLFAIGKASEHLRDLTMDADWGEVKWSWDE